MYWYGVWGGLGWGRVWNGGSGRGGGGAVQIMVRVWQVRG